jgi:hypothetical protein
MLSNLTICVFHVLDSLCICNQLIDGRNGVKQEGSGNRVNANERSKRRGPPEENSTSSSLDLNAEHITHAVGVYVEQGIVACRPSETNNLKKRVRDQIHTPKI